MDGRERQGYCDYFSKTNKQKPPNNNNNNNRPDHVDGSSLGLAGVGVRTLSTAARLRDRHALNMWQEHAQQQPHRYFCTKRREPASYH